MTEKDELDALRSACGPDFFKRTFCDTRQWAEEATLSGAKLVIVQDAWVKDRSEGGRMKDYAIDAAITVMLYALRALEACRAAIVGVRARCSRLLAKAARAVAAVNVVSLRREHAHLRALHEAALACEAVMVKLLAEEYAEVGRLSVENRLLRDRISELQKGGA